MDSKEIFFDDHFSCAFLSIKGVTFPAVHAILGRWSPVYERSKLATLVYSGISTIFLAIIDFVSHLVCKFLDLPPKTNKKNYYLSTSVKIENPYFFSCNTPRNNLVHKLKNKPLNGYSNYKTKILIIR